MVLKTFLIACVDDLKPLTPYFLNPKSSYVSVHMVRNSVKNVPWKDYKAVTADLKQIYQSTTEEEALLALKRFSDK